MKWFLHKVLLGYQVHLIILKTKEKTGSATFSRTHLYEEVWVGFCVLLSFQACYQCK